MTVNVADGTVSDLGTLLDLPSRENLYPATHLGSGGASFKVMVMSDRASLVTLGLTVQEMRPSQSSGPGYTWRKMKSTPFKAIRTLISGERVHYHTLCVNFSFKKVHERTTPKN